MKASESLNCLVLDDTRGGQDCVFTRHAQYEKSNRTKYSFFPDQTNCLAVILDICCLHETPIYTPDTAGGRSSSQTSRTKVRAGSKKRIHKTMLTVI